MYEFEHCPPAGRPSRVRAWVEQRGLQSSRGLVFATTEKAAEEAATALCGHGVKAAPYHSGMTAADRAKVMLDWQAGRVLQVATSSLAVDVDVSDVRFVVHCGLPPTITDYVREVGRGGRDGELAQCFAVYDLADSLSWAAQLSLPQPPMERRILEMQVFAAQPDGCRSAHLQRQFDVSADADAAARAAPAAAASQDAATSSTCCDVCSGSVAVSDGSVPPDRDAALRQALMTLSSASIDSRATWQELSTATEPAAWRELSQRDKDSTALSMLRSGILQLDYACVPHCGIAHVYLAPGLRYDG